MLKYYVLYLDLSISFIEMKKLEKVLLIFPKTGLDVYSQLPLGLLSVASTIVDDYEVKIIDQRTENNWGRKIYNGIARFNLRWHNFNDRRTNIKWP